jgi:hypothetical protein
VSASRGVYDSRGVSDSMFVSNIQRAPLLFNKEVTQQRINEVMGEYNRLCGSWEPTFNNLHALYLANGEAWEKTPIPQAKALQKEEAYSEMPKEAIEYLRGLPEFDAKVFEEVTGKKVKAKK